MSRAALALVFSLAALLSLSPQPSLARGIALRGQEIDRNTGVSGKTGTCSCQWNWYTVGLKPGAVEVRAAIVTFMSVGSGSTYGIRVALVHDGKDQAVGKIACPSSDWHCHKSLRFTYRVKHPGVYYLVVQGISASDITFVMGIRGNVYPLHCRHQSC